MKQINEHKLFQETETGYAAALLLLNLLVLTAAAGLIWILYLLFTRSNEFGFFVREFALR